MKKIFLLIMLNAFTPLSYASVIEPFISNKPSKGSFPVATQGHSAGILISSHDWPGVLRAAGNLQTDIEQVSGLRPSLNSNPSERLSIIVGTIGKSEIIDKLIETGKIDVSQVSGKWESTLIQVVKNPIKGIDSALVIAGSDKRGTIYGIYELSYQIGVSPWYYWADVPIKKSSSLFASPGKKIINSPAVKYRGIFLNDEAPALSGWTHKQFGGFNHKLYEKVFELILRLKGNYLWPAMWGNAFNDDDKLNPVLADEYGIVMGTSHHEPMLRSQQEWKRFGKGQWNYEANKNVLSDFWRTGIKNMGSHESIVTIGMRGDGDEPMTEGTATALLERIVADQREIITQTTGKPADKTPQLWALYKEVQDYYEKGMRVPDDVTLLLCDDNWGNLRKLPRPGEQSRSGGYGIYYHFDYVGGPRNYKWINTNPIQKTWEQMNLAYRHKANQIWIVNVGDLKPMEFPIEFFLDYAWSPDSIPSEKLKAYTVNWSAKQFGSQNALAIADMVDEYLKYNGRIKPELLDEKTYSLLNYREFERVVEDFTSLEKRANEMNERLPEAFRAAFYQLVLHPVQANSNLHRLYLALAKNRLYAAQGRMSTNKMALMVDSLFLRDAAITNYYNKILLGGKWNHMMDQTHIGYTGWQQPEKNIKPTTSINNTPQRGIGLSLEGSVESWSGTQKIKGQFPELSSFDQGLRYFEVFNKGIEEMNYRITSPKHIKILGNMERLHHDGRFYIQVDWGKAPEGKSISDVIIDGEDGSKIVFSISLTNHNIPASGQRTFRPSNGYISIESPNFSKKVETSEIKWRVLENYGKTKGAVIMEPIDLQWKASGKLEARLEYDVFLTAAGSFELNSFISPTIDFTNSDGLSFAVSVDNEKPQQVNISKDFKTDAQWEKSVANNIKIFNTKLKFMTPGKHTIKYWAISPGVVLQKLVLNLGGLKHSYLGPPESMVK
ncbi:MAG: glycosyl hydrolase [Pedobacter sp.]|nr:MAG: glycosyl hydrolase [Pedobacter sp.]